MRGQGGTWSPGNFPIADTNTPTIYQTEAYDGIAGGPHTAIEKQFPVNVANGVVQIRLEGTRWGSAGPAPSLVRYTR
ncbi:MAG TPA: hypothetical protein VJ732_00330 [Bryobacteraceae bacterium]|nr:hypothetical protein [Bryobacteraceae bacterium]